MGGGCELPLGAHCLAYDTGWLLYAQVLSPDGEASVQVAIKAERHEPAQELGTRAAEVLIGRGALQLLEIES
jgi:hydroxymethylbilane synthase